MKITIEKLPMTDDLREQVVIAFDDRTETYQSLPCLPGMPGGTQQLAIRGLADMVAHVLLEKLYPECATGHQKVHHMDGSHHMEATGLASETPGAYYSESLRRWVIESRRETPEELRRRTHFENIARATTTP